MATKFKVAILGIGGVGGFLGGKLAAHYAGSMTADVIFIARGENEKAIKANGLKLITSESEQIIHPSIVTSEPNQLGFANLIICCVKSYDLEESLELLKPCINSQTIILPVLNGVDAFERIKNIFPQAKVWEGCIYIVSRLIAPGIVKESGNINLLYFGSKQGAKKELERLESFFRSAGINAHLSDDISQAVWEKFLFISPLATLTSYLDLGIGGIMNNNQHSHLLLNLLTEVKLLADEKKIAFSENIIQKTLNKIASLPFGATSSMHSDFQKGNKTEVDSLTAYVIKLGNELSIPTPYYVEMLTGLREKWPNMPQPK